jgi:hypothetical protein
MTAWMQQYVQRAQRPRQVVRSADSQLDWVSVSTIGDMETHAELPYNFRWHDCIHRDVAKRLNPSRPQFWHRLASTLLEDTGP